MSLNAGHDSELLVPGAGDSSCALAAPDHDGAGSSGGGGGAAGGIPPPSATGSAGSRRYLPPSVLDFFSSSGTSSAREKRKAERVEQTEAVMLDLSQRRRFVPSSPVSRGGSPPGSGGGSGSSPHSSHNKVAAGEVLIGEMRDIIGSVNFLNQYVSQTAKVFCVLVIICALVPTGGGIAVLVTTYAHSRDLLMSDASPCSGTYFADIKTNNLGYNIANVFVSSVFMPWMAAHAVRLEKEGLLAIFSVVSIAHVARLMYFSFDASLSSAVGHVPLMTLRVLNVASAVGLLVSLPLAGRVYHSFGWRLYAKGVTVVQDIRQMHRYKQFDACLKLDVYVCLISFVSIFFLVSNNTARAIGFVIAIITIGVLLAFPTFIRRNAATVVYLAFAACFMMPSYYTFVVADLLSASGHTCQDDLLDPCLGADNITYTRADTPAAAAAHVHAALPVNSSAPGYTWVLRECKSGNTTACADFVHEVTKRCCNEYGQCERKQEFRQHDRVLMIVTATVGFALRAVTIFLAYRQLQAMHLPSVRELFRRGERNLRNLSLHTFIPGHGGGGSGGEEKLDTLIDPDEALAAATTRAHADAPPLAEP